MMRLPAAGEASAGREGPPAWAVHRRLYDWVLSLAHRRHSTLALFLLAFAESSFFPIPPDVLQVAMTLERRARAFWYAAVSTSGSVAGGVAGYLIGWGLWRSVEGVFIPHIIRPEHFERVSELYQRNAFWTVFAAAFTPIPYKVFTIAAGVAPISILALVAASVLGRGGRFFLVAALLWWVGPPVRAFVERYFNLLTLAGGALVIGAVVAWKMSGGGS